MMRTRTFTIPQLMLLIGTRVAFGVGIGLLAAGRLDRRYRRGAGRALVTVGALTTIPLVLDMMGRARAA